MQKLPPYLFARIEKKLEKAQEEGVDVISLGIGDPDRPTPEHIIEAMARAIANPANHRYPTSVGLLSFRQAVADWFKRRFGVTLDPREEVVALLGSKEGIAHIAFCFLEPGDMALVPDPGYPVYSIGTILVGAEPYYMPLRAENGFLPVLEDIPEDVARRAKLLHLNYPNNPTGAFADREFFMKAIEFARNYDILICHDHAYSEIAFDGQKPISLLEVEGGREVGIEFHSFSKSFNMTGWRLGWACGNAEAIEVLTRFKSNVDSGVFQAVQEAGIAALSGSQECIEEMCAVYQERRDAVVEGLNRMGWKLNSPPGTIYVWAPVPQGYTSASFAELVLDKAGVVITPGVGYGQFGEGYFRIALTVEVERIQEALERMYQAIGKVEF
ncbi:MAG: LL-diaminopimelate aminotransferase [Syntrophomonadaceae bacterium]|jgi:LL-diaminopimelate aminotransferase|nr:LL-diaminopimelate aminotransferase [Syntrophomonadaceae bacterium]